MEILILNLLSDILWTPNPFCAGKHTVRTRKFWIEYRLSSAFLLELRNVATDISNKELTKRFSNMRPQKLNVISSWDTKRNIYFPTNIRGFFKNLFHKF